MREEYNIKDLIPRKNPYATSKQQITLDINTESVEYFKSISAEVGIPYHVLMGLYLDQCAKEKKTIKLT